MRKPGADVAEVARDHQATGRIGRGPRRGGMLQRPAILARYPVAVEVLRIYVALRIACREALQAIRLGEEPHVRVQELPPHDGLVARREELHGSLRRIAAPGSEEEQAVGIAHARLA